VETRTETAIEAAEGSKTTAAMSRTMRRIARSAWLRALLALLLCLVAVPGTLPARGVASAAPAASAAAVAAAAKQRARSIADDQVRVLYCTSCGYQQSFVQVKDFLEDKYPHLVDRVYGVNYDVSPAKQVSQPHIDSRRFSGLASISHAVGGASARGTGHRVRADHLHGPHGLWRIRTSGGLPLASVNDTLSLVSLAADLPG
jgi:selT/selW/selH-like putative selenoprotein